MKKGYWRRAGCTPLTTKDRSSRLSRVLKLVRAPVAHARNRYCLAVDDAGPVLELRRRLDAASLEDGVTGLDEANIGRRSELGDRVLDDRVTLDAPLLRTIRVYRRDFDDRQILAVRDEPAEPCRDSHLEARRGHADGNSSVIGARARRLRHLGLLARLRRLFRHIPLRHDFRRSLDAHQIDETHASLLDDDTAIVRDEELHDEQKTERDGGSDADRDPVARNHDPPPRG